MLAVNEALGFVPVERWTSGELGVVCELAQFARRAATKDGSPPGGQQGLRDANSSCRLLLA